MAHLLRRASSSKRMKGVAPHEPGSNIIPGAGNVFEGARLRKSVEAAWLRKSVEGARLRVSAPENQPPENQSELDALTKAVQAMSQNLTQMRELITVQGIALEQHTRLLSSGGCCNSPKLDDVPDTVSPVNQARHHLASQTCGKGSCPAGSCPGSNQASFTSKQLLNCSPDEQSAQQSPREGTVESFLEQRAQGTLKWSSTEGNTDQV